MTLIITDTVDDPSHPIDRPYDVRERSLTPLERLAFVATSIEDLKKAAALQESIIKAHAAGNDTVRVGRALLLDVTEERAEAARENFHRVNREIEKLAASIADVAKAYGVKLGSGPAYGRIVVDGGL